MAWNPFAGRRSTPVDRPVEVARLLRQAFADQGVETVLADGCLRGADGRLYGLDTVTHAAASVPPRRWPALVREHVDRLLAAEAEPEPTSMDEVRDVLHLRVVNRHDLPGAMADLARPLGGELAVLPAIDRPDAVSMVGDPAVVERLGGWDAVWDTGLANLQRLRADETFTVADGQVHVSAGGFLNASRMLTLDTLLAQDFGLERPAHGVLLVVPNRHLVAVHVLHGEEMVGAIQTMLSLAQAQSTHPGGISDSVHFWRDGVLQQVSGRGGSGEVSVVVDGALAEALAELGLMADG